MEINDFEIIWLYVIDSGKWIKKKSELKEIAENLMNKAKIVTGILRYYTPEELEILPKSEKIIRASIRAETEDIEKILKLFYKLDMNNIDPEYLENLRFFRAKFVDFKIKLPNDQIEPVVIRLMYHHSGVMALEFSLRLNKMALTSDIINEFQLLPRDESELSVILPRELLEDYSEINPKLKEVLEKNPTKESFKRNMTFHEVVWAYWATLIRIANNKNVKDSKSILESLRYEVFNFVPILIFNFPEIQSPDELLKKYKPEIYMMLTQEIYLEADQIQPRLIEEVLTEKKNLAERIDHAIFISLESCMLLYTKESKAILEGIAKKRKIPLEELFLMEKFEILLIEEFLQLQKYNMEMYDYILSKKSISEMETDELAQMRGRVSHAIEEFYNIKLFVKINTIKRFDKVRIDIFELNRSLEVLEKKLELVDAAVSSIHTNLMEFLTILLGILVQLGPIIALTIGAQNPILAASIAIGVFVGVYFLYKQIYRIWYRRRKI